MLFIEVKGKAEGKQTVSVSKTQILTALNKPDDFILAVVPVDGERAQEPIYIRKPFENEPDFSVTSVNFGLAKLLERGDLQLVPLDDPLQKRTRALMSKYRDTPMDLADASLVAVAEALDDARVFTLDRDFQIYRWKGRRKFEVVP